MRTAALALALFTVACARELRSTNPDAWLELQSQHFTLRTDLNEEDARGAIGDLELIRNALLAAGWHGKTISPARIGVVALASGRELREFVGDQIDGMAGTSRFGERMILVRADGNLLESEVVKHEVTHALMQEYLVTNPRWVAEGIACFLETLDIDAGKLEAVRGASQWQRRRWLRDRDPKGINWSLQIMGMGSNFKNYDGFAYETLSWALVHWMVDEHPDKFAAFLRGLSRGEGMWKAFGQTFPTLSEAHLSAAMNRYLSYSTVMLKERFRIQPWAGAVAVRRMGRADAHALRAELFGRFANRPDRRTKFDDELAAASAADPANPLVLGLSTNRPDLKPAIERHPDDWRSWVLWFDENDKDVRAIRKAAELAPDNASVLARLALAEQGEGRSKDAVTHAERAASIFPNPFVLHSLASVYDAIGRCSDATTQEERAIEALPDRVDERAPAFFRKRLDEIAATCGKGDVIGTAAEKLEAEPVLRICRQPLSLRPRSASAISTQFTVREDGSVGAVTIQGAENEVEAGILRQFVESCSFEPVLIKGKARRVQLDLTLDSFLQQR